MMIMTIKIHNMRIDYNLVLLSHEVRERTYTIIYETVRAVYRLINQNFGIKFKIQNSRKAPEMNLASKLWYVINGDEETGAVETKVWHRSLPETKWPNTVWFLDSAALKRAYVLGNDPLTSPEAHVASCFL
jgi:hypothetical protein